MVFRIFTSFLLIFVCYTHTNAHVYTSVANLEKLWNAESSLITSVEGIVEQLETQIQASSMFSEIVQAKIAAKEKSFHETPLSTFSSLRRLTLDWADSESVLYANDFKMDEVFEKIMNETSVEHSEQNVEGAALGLSRLQTTYDLKTADIAAGILKGKQFSSPMSAHDCYNVGLFLVKAQRYSSANEWLLQAKHMLDQDVNSTLSQEFPALLEETVLPTLVESLIKSENFQLAERINKKLSKYSPETAKQNSELIKNTLDKKRLYQPNFDNWKINTQINEVCAGKAKQTPAEQRPLRCRYICNLKPNCIISPYRLEEHNLDPFVGVFENVIYEHEMEYIKTNSLNELERSGVVNQDILNLNDIRTSQTSWMTPDEHPTLYKFKQRMLEITGLSLEYAEPLQVVNYGIGGHYSTHHDFLGEGYRTFTTMGDRILTALFYLNDVDLGGATAFTKLRITVHPKKGSALLWYNLQRDLSTDYRTYHSGCPVLKGSKWIANEWFHAYGQEFKRPCGLKPDPTTNP